MEILQMPEAIKRRGIKGWPKIMVIRPGEPTPEPGVPYIRCKENQDALIFRLLVPMLKKTNPYFKWEAVYQELTGYRYKPASIFYQVGSGAFTGDGDNATGINTMNAVEEMTLEEMASDTASVLDIDVLLEMKMIPAFYEDIAAAVRVNVTNNFAWYDGYNKKTKLCTGYLIEQARKKSLIILDISWSIPEAVSAGMLTLIQTITEITHADLILTGGKSYFYTNDEVKHLDINAERRRIPRSNEDYMFTKILKEEIIADYDIVIVFGDADNPGDISLPYPIHTKKLYSFWSPRYRYADYRSIAGYGRWVKQNNPDVEVIHNTEWVKFFDE